MNDAKRFYTIGKRIRFLRDCLGLSQEHLAKHLQLDRTIISNIEQDKRELKVDEFIKLSQVLNVSVGQLIGTENLPEVVLEIKKDIPNERITSFRISVPARDIQKFKEALLYILKKVGAKPNIGETVLYKLLYFIDFDYFEKFKNKLIGATYIKNHYGPTPIEFQKIVQEMIDNDEITKLTGKVFDKQQKKYFPLRDPDLLIFNAQEINMIDKVLAKLSDMNAIQISDYSHGDFPWQATADGCPINYELAFSRTSVYSARDMQVTEDNYILAHI